VPCRLDIIIVVDESASVGSTNFGKTKVFISELVGTLDIDSTSGARVGVVTFGTHVDQHELINLKDHSTVADVQAAIDALAYTGGGTKTDQALNYVRTDMLTSASGDRPDVPNVVIVITDGKSKNRRQTKVCTRSSATAEKQRVSCPHGGGLGLPAHSPSAHSGYTYAYGQSQIRNPQQTYLRRAVH